MERLAWRVAIWRSRFTNRAICSYDKYEIAWSAIAEELYARDDDDAPSEWDLLDSGERAIHRHVMDEWRTHGRSDRADRGQNGRIARFYAYWETTVQYTTSPEREIIESVALAQIWRRLSKRNKEVLAALAIYDTYEAAAKALGVSRNSISTMVWVARQQFFRFWHEHEMPSKFWGRDTKIDPEGRRAGEMKHSRAVRSLRRRAKRRKGRHANGKDGHEPEGE
ncbi:hypothetical protein [Spongiactinospora rosea]|uniref:hypothetical protein n=1 Tax=Spongiactinospora rosea TaxID=2248750 RepID=UPI0011C035F7|nr:hypothetical protein [Spongiactinospora rosea]